jgi:hypothetical protein
MLESFSRKRGRLTSLFPGRLAPPWSRFPFLGRSKNFPRHSCDGTLLELPGRASRSFLSAVNGIAEHLRDRCRAAKKMNLKTVCLFFSPRLGVNAPDI